MDKTMPGFFLKDPEGEQEYYPDDILCGLIFYAKLPKLTSNSKELHIAMSKLKKDHPKLLRRFVFSTSGTYDYSRTLEKAIFRLITARIIKAENPDYPDFNIPSSSHIYIENEIVNKIFEDEDKKEIIEMANEFKILTESASG